MKLANTGGFVDGIRVGPIDNDSARGDEDHLESAWVFDEFAAHPKARSKLSEPVLRDRDQDLMSLSDRAFTDPPPARPDWTEGSDRLLEQRLLAASRLRSFGTASASEAQKEVPVNASQALLIGQRVGLKSLGSAHHPLNCTECYFHTFSSTGCTAGAYCSFCHEQHPQRKQPKRNRRLRKPNSQALGVGTSNDSFDGKSSSSVSLVPSVPQRQQLSLMDDAQSRQMAAVQNSVAMDNVANSDLGGPRGPASASSSSARRAKAEVIHFRYLDREDPSTPALLTLVVGVGVHFPAIVEMAPEKRAALQDHISYLAEPPFPEGVFLHRQTGLISGIPTKAQECASVHHVSINIEATGPGGVSLGNVAVTSCTIAIRIVDARGYVLSWAEEKVADGEPNHILLKLQKC
mmetsp:Transcript_82953/g.130808  ORF Transcript_82953/g.130808 Transcript_82953/m.130808 type:complete len:405 (+) Transcript_82953:119-1333(+)